MGASPNSFKIVGDPLGTEEFGFIFKPGSDLVAPFNAAITAMKADGTHRQAEPEVVLRVPEPEVRQRDPRRRRRTGAAGRDVARTRAADPRRRSRTRPSPAVLG